jgi:aminoglycoside phosphotransferase (APT) family kinase protein
MSETLPPLVDADALSSWLSENLGIEGDVQIQRHQAGHSNETFFVKAGDERFVLRRPPRGAFLPTAHDVGREYRVLQALSSTSVRSPKTIADCRDESVIGAPFYLMEMVSGVVIRTELPDAFSEEHRARMGDELVDALVELHSVDPVECGLEGFGKPSGYLERQLRRWKGQMELTLPFTRPIPDLEAVGEWLASDVPVSQRAAIVHGDYKLDNVVFSTDTPPRLVSILDWEMSTLGDPLADLGWMASFWLAPGEADETLFADHNQVTTLPGFRSRDELVERYSSATGLDASRLDWYIVLAIWKLAILLEGSYARHLSGVTDDPFFARMEEGVPALARAALGVAEG